MGFHEGELHAQRMANELDVAARNLHNVTSHIIRPALPFVRQQTMVYVASVDDSGRVWASVLLGAKGFLDATEAALTVDLDRVAVQPRDPLWQNLESDARVGLLLLELTTRRRLKVNGTAVRDGSRLVVHVTESVPICPRYIQRRTVELPAHGEMPSTVDAGHTLGATQLELVRNADTLFLATTHATRGPDCTHRGGPRGFVEVLADGGLRVPDYNGNGMFNSAGNVQGDPHAGLVIPDYVTRRMLQLTGRAEMRWNQPDPDGVTGGTHRFWHFAITDWLETRLPDGLRTEFVDASPFLPRGR